MQYFLLKVHNIYQVPPMVTVQSRTFWMFGHTPKCVFPIINIIISFVSSFYYLCLRSSLHRLTTSSAYSVRVFHRYHGSQRPDHCTKPHFSLFLAISSDVLYHSGKCQLSHKTALPHWFIEINVSICLSILAPDSVLISVERWWIYNHCNHTMCHCIIPFMSSLGLDPQCSGV